MLEERAESKKLFKLNLSVFEPEQVPLHCQQVHLVTKRDCVSKKIIQSETEFSKPSLDTIAILDKGGFAQVKAMSGIRVKLADSEGDISEMEASTDFLIDKLGNEG